MHDNNQAPQTLVKKNLEPDVNSSSIEQKELSHCNSIHRAAKSKDTEASLSWTTLAVSPVKRVIFLQLRAVSSA